MPGSVNIVPNSSGSEYYLKYTDANNEEKVWKIGDSSQVQAFLNGIRNGDLTDYMSEIFPEYKDALIDGKTDALAPGDMQSMEQVVSQRIAPMEIALGESQTISYNGQTILTTSADGFLVDDGEIAAAADIEASSYFSEVLEALAAI